MRHAFLTLPLLLAASPLALAAQPCAHSAPLQLQLDLEGVRQVRFEAGPHDLRLDAAPGAAHRLAGRACASRAELLGQLEVTQQREDQTLVVRLHSGAKPSLLPGNHYARIELAGSVPDDRLVQLLVGSGQARLQGAASASVDLGSGDVELHRIRGQVTARVGSGDLEVRGAGALKVLDIGSGDVEASDIAGATEVQRIGSGELELERGASLEIGTIGSGDANARDLTGAVRVGRIGSGDLRVHGAASLEVGAVGSGDIEHDGIKGSVQLPRGHH